MMHKLSSPSVTAATAQQVVEALRAMADASQRQVLMRFFQTGPGQYAEGDRFLGVRVPQVRQVV
ncbi:MAG: DNA alkylation repair protein, partial [Bacteroidales bacterium]|nr:DNA alkylation repair protein [Bacteroidales bacterium]